MRAIDPALCKALPLSLLLHAILLAVGGWLVGAEPGAVSAPKPQLDVRLWLREEPVPPQPQLLQPSARLPLPARTLAGPFSGIGYAARVERGPVGADAGTVLEGEAAQRANAQLARELLYPPEAIARGLEGQVLVLLFLDASGNAIGARLEASSGHALLDAAAVRAARTLRALPASAPREALLPVRFRLR